MRGVVNRRQAGGLIVVMFGWFRVSISYGIWYVEFGLFALHHLLTFINISLVQDLWHIHLLSHLHLCNLNDSISQSNDTKVTFIKYFRFLSRDNLNSTLFSQITFLLCLIHPWFLQPKDKIFVFIIVHQNVITFSTYSKETFLLMYLSLRRWWKLIMILQIQSKLKKFSVLRMR